MGRRDRGDAGCAGNRRGWCGRISGHLAAAVDGGLAAAAASPVLGALALGLRVCARAPRPFVLLLCPASPGAALQRERLALADCQACLQ